jgi:hypothetical protein
VGLPRVDLSVHAPTRDVEIGFVARLHEAGLQAQALEFLDAVTPREPAAGWASFDCTLVPRVEATRAGKVVAEALP